RRLKMSTTLYQVMFAWPRRYEATEDEKKMLRDAVSHFVDEYGEPRLGVAGVKVSWSTGFFLVFADSEEHASWMPPCFDGFEQRWDALAVPSDKVYEAGPMYVSCTAAS